ncbi:MAG: hypothetical protein ACK4QL_01930 [Pseudanabaenaceae cyanobacterium]
MGEYRDFDPLLPARFLSGTWVSITLGSYAQSIKLFSIWLARFSSFLLTYGGFLGVSVFILSGLDALAGIWHKPSTIFVYL